MDIIGYIAAILIGLSLGLTGGGGSILTVPVLVYLFGIEPVLATGYSLFIVGATSFAGGVRAYMYKQVDFRAVSLFGIPSIFTIFIARHFILPVIPDTINIFSFSLQKGSFLMIVFALLMLAASYFMMVPRKEEVREDADDKQYKSIALLVPGLFVGLLTGLLGAGGGFMIIPALVLILQLPMKKAIGTSLHIIAINSLFGFLFSLNQYSFNWKLLFIVTILAIAGVVAGTWFSKRIENKTLRKVFGWFVLAMGFYILVKELLIS
ncbi:MAG: sulfite exporter TauE/SafE family protein [Lacibacter sp.]